MECRRDSAGDAYAAAGAASAAVSGALRGKGVQNPDISTSGLNVRADVVWQEGRGQQVTGYVASSILSVRLRNPAAGSGIIAAAVEAGGNDVRLDGVHLGFADTAAVMSLAREAAWSDARAAAAQLAGLAGAELGEVVSVRQHPVPSAPIPVGGMQRAFAADAMTVEAGQSSVSTSVTVEWELLLDWERRSRRLNRPPDDAANGGRASRMAAAASRDVGCRLVTEVRTTAAIASAIDGQRQ